MRGPPVVPRRQLGKSTVSLSPLTLGTMRLDPDRLNRDTATDILALLVDQGVDCFHTSTEYHTFEFFGELFARTRARFPDKQFLIIGKVGVPHFGEDAFSRARFEAEVDRYLLNLGIDCLDVVQWSLRYNLERDDRRLEIFCRDADTIASTVEDLRKAGKLRAIVSFPYSMGVGLKALQEPWCDGLALYVNPLERSMNSLLDESQAREKGVVAIRPFAAGRIFTEATGFDRPDWEAINRLTIAWPGAEPAERALGYALAHPAVATTTASIGSRQHAAEAAGWATMAGIHEERWKCVAGS